MGRRKVEMSERITQMDVHYPFSFVVAGLVEILDIPDLFVLGNHNVETHTEATTI